MSLLLASPNTTEREPTGRLTQPWTDHKSRGLTLPQRYAREAVFRMLDQLRDGSITLSDADCSRTFGGSASATGATNLHVHDLRFYPMAVFGGDISIAEAYLRGYWDCPDLVALMRMFARNLPVLSNMERRGTRWLRPLRRAWNWFQRNNRTGSRRNIAAHYDLSNRFFSLFLDSTMTYSSGIFETPEATLEDSSIAKYERICRKLELTESDHLVEVGCGWGGFAEYAAREYGCRVTATTISAEQYAYAEQRIRDADLCDRVTLCREDYRDLTGSFDALVSIEMIEAVGEKYLDTYFGKCCQLLKPGGKMVLQTITIPDHRYDQYCRSVDFIQRYVFPGGFLPSFSAIGQSLGRATDFRLNHQEDFGRDYATTLACWRENFWNHIESVRQLGFDERFVRMWHYYLCYCEAGFRERQIGVSQFVFQRA